MHDSVTVLHVDDDEEFAALTGTYLASEDDSLDVTTFHDPEPALERLAAGDVDCVVTDFDMGSADGVELIEKVRERAPDVPCLLFTARNNEALVERALDAGATEYLQKGRPAQFTLLAHRIHTAVTVHAADGEDGRTAEGAPDRWADGETAAGDGGTTAAETPTGAAPSAASGADLPGEDRWPDGVRHPDERIEELASVVSHDLQNPLTIARGYLDRARTHGDDEYFEHVEDALAEIGEISEGVVEMARLGQRIERFDAVDVESVVRSCWQEIEAPEATLEVEDVDPVAGRRKHLLVLFEHLLENAVRHGSPDDGGVTVTVGETEAGLFVADDGDGIPPEQREQALEAGYSTVQGNPGLGLPIARSVAEAHGWRFSLGESEAGGLRVDIDGVTPADGA